MTSNPLQDALLMLVILNPFAQILFLSKLMNQTGPREFASIFGRGTAMTFLILALCAIAGEILLFRIFQVTLPAMRIFGGLINLHLAYTYVMKGPTGIKLFRGDVAELAQQVTLPIMVGAGVVWISIRLGQVHSIPVAVAIIASVLGFNALLVMGYDFVFRNVKGAAEILLVKHFGIAMRFNAMLIGAVSIEMILGGISEFMASHST